MLFVEHKGLVLTRSQILDDLWGDSYPIIDRTIDTYIKNLRKKLRPKKSGNWNITGVIVFRLSSKIII